MIAQIDKINLESGIYCIIHRDSLMCYVGSSVDMGRRRRTHSLNAKKGSLTYVHRMIREFGENAFDFEVLEYCDKYKLVERETFWIKFLNAASIEGMNTLKNPSSCYDYGKSYSEVTRQRLREAVLGKPRSQEIRDKISASSKGKKKTPEHVEKVRQSQINKVITEEQRVKMSIAQTGRKHTPEHIQKVINSRLGKPLSEAHKEKLRVVNTGRKLTEEQKEKLRVHFTGIKQSEKTILNRVTKNTGKKRTPEQIQRMKEGMRRGIENRKAAAEALKNQ